MKTKKLYKFLRTGLKSQHGNHQWKVGEWYKEQNISICDSGFHASSTPLQALGYVAGEIIAEVEVRGKSIVQEDKSCHEEMRIVRAFHWKKEDSVAFSLYAAEKVIENYEKEYPDDSRPRDAIEAAKKWLANPTEDNRSAAESAAWSAAESARSAARSAAESAARSAESAARSAAWSAAESAARSAESAAESAAWSAAESAARSAAWSARSAAWSAESAAYDKAYKALVADLDAWFIARIETLEPYE